MAHGNQSSCPGLERPPKASLSPLNCHLSLSPFLPPHLPCLSHPIKLFHESPMFCSPRCWCACVVVKDSSSWVILWFLRCPPFHSLPGLGQRDSEGLGRARNPPTGVGTAMAQEVGLEGVLVKQVVLGSRMCSVESACLHRWGLDSMPSTQGCEKATGKNHKRNNALGVLSPGITHIHRFSLSPTTHRHTYTHTHKNALIY